VEIIAQRNTKKRMQKMGVRGRGLPTRTFRRKLTLFSGADQVDLLYFGRGHTNGDTWVYFRALGVVHVGDLFPGDDLPLLDARNGGSALAIGRTLENGYRAIKGAQLIVTGHGAERTWPELLEYTSFNNRFVDEMWRARQGLQSDDDVVRDWSIPASYQKYAPVDADRLRNNVALTFKELNEEARMNAAAYVPYDFVGAYPGASPPVHAAASPAPAPAAPVEPPPPSGDPPN
jgi:glyoxylase-like metal-dependent hydrolase (beta-lactamase superfamily II)